MTEKLHVTGMTCGGCENAIKRAVGRLTGVSEVSASHAEQSVAVSYDPEKVTLEAIKSRIQALGYQVA